MLNFNAIDNTTSFSHSMPLHGGNFTEVPTSMVATSASSSVQVQQINLNYLNANTSGADQTNWSHNPTTAAIDNNCNRTTVTNNNLTHSNESARVQQQKSNYLQTTINDDQNNCRPPLSMDTFLHQKGSENVKRFSVNNLLQLANNCRALVDDHRLSSGKFKSHLVTIQFYGKSLSK